MQSNESNDNKNEGDKSHDKHRESKALILAYVQIKVFEGLAHFCGTSGWGRSRVIFLGTGYLFSRTSKRSWMFFSMLKIGSRYDNFSWS